MRQPILSTTIALLVLAIATCLLSVPLISAEPDNPVQVLGKELADKGWLVFAGHPQEIDKSVLIPARNGRGPTDLYICRPDGSGLRAITRTPDYSEYGARFSHDGKKILYRRLPARREINHDQWGMFGELVVASADGSDPVVVGKDGEYPWAYWSPDEKQISCLYKNEGLIRIFDVAAKKLIKEMPAQGIYQQLYWSPDGKKLIGTANLAGREWNIVAIDIDSGKLTQVSRAVGGGNCTPDWFQKDPNRVIYSSRETDITWLMQGTADGKARKMVFARARKHIYFGCTSPDDKYLVCADDPEDSLIVGEMRIVRLADTPIIIGLKGLKEVHPDAKEGPVFDLKLPNGVPLRGFEPDWNYADIPQKK